MQVFLPLKKSKLMNIQTRNYKTCFSQSDNVKNNNENKVIAFSRKDKWHKY